MIIGIGSDLCSVERLAGAIERQGQRFLNRVFSRAEQREAAGQARPDLFYAGLFAAKEACVKALGTGVTERVRWTDVEIASEGKSEPELRLSGGAYRRMRRLIGPGNCERLVLSISRDRQWASALVILERTGPSVGKGARGGL